VEENSHLDVIGKPKFKLPKYFTLKYNKNKEPIQFVYERQTMRIKFDSSKTLDENLQEFMLSVEEKYGLV